MAKNQTSVEQHNEEHLISNSEILERQLTFLMTIQSYLIMQLDEVEKKLEELKPKL